MKRKERAQSYGKGRTAYTMNEYVIIYRQECGAKYSCIETNADTAEEAKRELRKSARYNN